MAEARRNVSFDSSPYFNSSSSSYKRRLDAPRENSDEDNYDPLAFRSQSVERVMHRLPFDRVQEDIQHPLSSKRSCSEFNDFGFSPIDTEAIPNNKKSKSFWKKFFYPNSKKSKDIEQKSFESFSSTSSIPFTAAHFMDNVNNSSRSPHKGKKYNSSFSDEIGIALDIVFGYKPKSGNDPAMEIELKCLDSTETVSRTSSSRGDQDERNASLPRSNSIRSYSSGRSGRTSRSNSMVRSSRSNSSGALSDQFDEATSSGSIASLGFNYPPQLQYLSWSSWQEYFSYIFESYTLSFRRYCVPGDNDFFYNLQIQPFSSGIYLRGMLAAGSNSLLFHTYTLIFLPADIRPFWSAQRTTWFDFEQLVVALLVIQVVLNLLACPVRMILHYECWQTTRAYDTDRASHALQDLIQTNVWLLNRILVWGLDAIGVLVIIIGEFYLLTQTKYSPLGMFFSTFLSSLGICDNDSAVLGSHDYNKDPLASLIIEMCSTNILSFLLRSLVALLYYLSIADPEVLNGKRRRKGGLSNFDLDLMPTFVFADSDEVVNNECSICLTNFEMGEMLISLPCHQRHSFHANCIREWLQHDAKCPLCQKGI